MTSFEMHIEMFCRNNVLESNNLQIDHKLIK